MKKLILAAFLLLHIGVNAQNETQTLFNGGRLKSWGLMVSPGLQTTQILNEQAVFGQFKAGLVLNESWTIGGLVGATLYDIYPNAMQAQFNVPTDFSFYTYGGFVEYRVRPNRLLHVAFPLALGVYETDMDDRDFGGPDFDGPDFDNSYGDDYRMFIEPGINLELNLHKYARLYAGVSYRAMGGPIYRDAQVPVPSNQFLVNAGLKFGVFNMASLKKK